MKKYETHAGDSFHTVAELAKEEAQRSKDLVFFDFNEIKCIVGPMTDLTLLWRDYSYAHLMEWKEIGPHFDATYKAEVQQELDKRTAASEERQRKQTFDKILHLTLKKKWFDMIASGEKKEEYREIKRYWADRLTYHEHHERITCENSLADEIYADQHRRYGTGVFKKVYTVVQFKNGYRKDSPTMQFKISSITWGYGVPEWGAEPGKKYFVIKLGERV